MYTDDNGIVRFEALDNIAPLQVNLNAALESVSDALDSSTRIWPVANASERDALGTGTPTKPLFAYRADTSMLEINIGSGWEVFDQWVPGRAFAMAAGSLTMQGTGTRDFDLPAGRFTQPPNIVISGSGGIQSPTQDVRAWATSPTKFTVRYQRADDWSATHTGSRTFNWQAVQMTPTSADG